MKLIYSIIKKIFSLTLTSKLCMLIYSIYQFARDYGYVTPVLYSEGFLKIIKSYLNIDLERDWIGRLYGIINPTIDINGNFNVSNMVIEINGDQTNNNEYILNWIYKQLNLIQGLFNFNNLYNYINLNVTHVGPVNGDNYLIVFDIASRQLVVKYFKQFIIQLIIYGLIFGLIFLFIL